MKRKRQKNPAQLSSPPPAPLFIPSLFWLAGLFAGFFLFSERIVEYYFRLIIPAATLFSLCFLIFRRQILKLTMLMLLVFLTAFTATSLSQYRPHNHISRYFGEEPSITQEVILRINSKPRLHQGQYGSYYRFVGSLEQIAGFDVSGNAIVRIPESYLAGDRIQLVRGNSMQVIANVFPYKNSSGFSRIPSFYFNNRKTTDVFINPVSLVELSEESKSIYVQFINSIDFVRSFFIERIDERVPAKHSAFIMAILIGERADMQGEREMLAKAGMAHLLAISGLHLSIITLVILTVFAAIGIRRTSANLLTILIIILYAEICGWTPSVSRATVMIVLYLITKTLQRKPSPNNILLAALVIITAVSPAQLFSLGLQFSFISVFVIVNVYPLVKYHTDKILGSERLKLSVFRRSVRWLLKYTLDIALLSTFISLFLSPLMMYYFSSISFNGIISNLVGIPLIGVIIPLALLTIFLPAPLGILEVYRNSLSFFLEMMNNWTNFAASLPLYFNFIPFSIIQALLLYVILLALYARWEKSVTAVTIPISGSSKVFKGRTALYYSAMLALFIVVIFPSIFGKTNLLKITMFDVGHGDLFLIQTPSKETIMVDAGPPPNQRRHFRNSALPYFRQNGIRTIDYLILTHPHNDHYGSFPDIMEELNVENVLLTKHFKQTTIWETLKESIDYDRTLVYAVTDTMKITELSIDNNIIHPDRFYYSENDNNMSIVMRIRLQNFVMLFTGDIEEDAEIYLANRYPAYLSAVFLKVPHHGSRTSSTDLFLEAVKPVFALIPAPIGGTHNMPHSEAMERLSAHVPAENIFKTGLDGPVRIKTDGLTAEIKTAAGRRINIKF